MMSGWDGYGYGAFHMVFWVVVLIAVIVAIVWLVRTMAPAATRDSSAPRSAGLSLLDERYARGEINRDEYLQKKGDLLG